ncbi:UNVERIFIED_CONTAM: 50S ribosomal protein L4, chloroplastic [Sesamum radiatum]|uniref:Large ribosomal subunit protein uL4c n=1 Tax=Sesamum radiatum TaxID=300843 RepID=A0AAW2UQ79_SESRA
MAAASPSSFSFFSSSVFLSNSNPSSTKFHFLKPQSHSRLRVSTTIHSELTTLPVLSFEGNQVGSASLNLKSAPPDTARAVVHRGLTTDLTNSRRGTASTLTRAEVRGGGQKPYPQKKTGRARRGSQRTPLRPVEVSFSAPSRKTGPSRLTRRRRGSLFPPLLPVRLSARLGLDPKKKSMFFMTEVSDNVRLSSRNIGTLKLLTPRTLNLFDILDSEKLILTKGAVEFLNERYGLDSEEDKEEDEFEEVEYADEG